MPIIVATDFSPHAREAADAAVAIAGALNDALKLVHVTGAEGDDGAPVSASREWATQQLAQEACRLRRTGVTVDDSLLAGNADEAIVEYARAIHAGLVVTGALGRRSAPRWRLGSVADRTAQISQCPVLIVRAAGPLVAWAKEKRPLRITVGDDFSNTGENALRWVMQLKRIGPVEVTVVHVYWMLGESSRLGYPVTSKAELDAILHRDLQDRLGALGTGEGSVTIRIASSYGRPAEPLIDAAVSDQADLIVVGTHQHGTLARAWNGSVSQVTTNLAPMSVAVVPAIEQAAVTPPPIPAIRQVLVSTDFSPAGNLAVAYACSILGRGGQVFVTHVIDSIPAACGMDSGAPRADRQAAEEEIAIQRQLEAVVPQDAAARGIEVHIEVLYGLSVPRAICQAAERTGADVICVGSHGRSAVARLVVGSVAQELIAQSRRPVLLVRSAPR